MKLKKTLSIIMAATLAMATMTGCSQATSNYSKETNKIAEWKATSTDIQGTFNVEAMGENIKFDMTSTAYMVGNDQGYINVKLNDKSGKVNMPEMKMYFDKGTAYINKSYYESMFTANGQAAPTGLANLKAEYIAVDSGMDMSTVQQLATKPDALIELSKTIFGNSGIDLPYVQNEREYTLNLDANQTIDLVEKTVKAVGNNIENINNTLKLGLKAQEINQIKTDMNGQEFNTALSKAKDTFKGSTISTKETFADDSYKQNINLNLQVKDFGKMSVELNSTSTKSEEKAIDMPTNKVKLTQEEFHKLLETENTTNTNQSIASTVLAAVK